MELPKRKNGQMCIRDRSGTNNIALEGTMLISAFVGVVVSAFTQSAWIGFFGAVLAGFLISNILAYFILKLNSNSVISGIALNTFASGGTTVSYTHLDVYKRQDLWRAEIRL